MWAQLALVSNNQTAGWNVTSKSESGRPAKQYIARTVPAFARYGNLMFAINAYMDGTEEK